MFASRAGAKLEYALSEFKIDITGKICADLGCSTGGFTDCLLQRGAAKVYSVDTGYGVLDWKLRNNSQVVVMERTNALHVTLPELMDFVSVDVSWTPQRLIVPKSMTLLKPVGDIVSLVKTHYEAQRNELYHGTVKPEFLDIILQRIIINLGIKPAGIVKSPILGEKGKNVEYLLWIHVG